MNWVSEIKRIAFNERHSFKVLVWCRGRWKIGRKDGVYRGVDEIQRYVDGLIKKYHCGVK